MQNLSTYSVHDGANGTIGMIIGRSTKTQISEGLVGPFIAVHYQAGISRKFDTQALADKWVRSIQQRIDQAIDNEIELIALDGPNA